MRFYSVIISASSLILLASALPVVQVGAVDEAIHTVYGSREYITKYLQSVTHEIFGPNIYRITEAQTGPIRSLLDEQATYLAKLKEITPPTSNDEIMDFNTLDSMLRNSQTKLVELSFKIPSIGIQMTHLAEDYLRLSAYSSSKLLAKDPLNKLHLEAFQKAKDNLSGVLAKRSQILKDHPDLVAHFPEDTVLQKNHRLIERLALDQRIADAEGALSSSFTQSLIEDLAYLKGMKEDLLNLNVDAETVGLSVGAKVAMGMATILTFVGLPLGLVVGIPDSKPPMYQPPTDLIAVQGGATTPSNHPIDPAGTKLA